ncbi:radical SAM protein [Candidatus Pacearchaeota archaeon]|nr:radical SAM protein [Candidatus Pacearchaeota archaeon]
MKIQTFTVIVGSAACNARCPYCISKMTGIKEMGYKLPEVNWHNFDKACRLSKENHVSTVLLTGKGEPTLFPDQFTEFLEHLKPYNFPLIEVQTNALVFGREFKKYKKYLKKWHELGLNTIAISVAHYQKEKNKEIYAPDSEYIELENVIKDLHEMGFSIRLCCMLIKDYVDTLGEVKNLIEFCKTNEVEQLTIRSIVAPNSSENSDVANWTRTHIPNKKFITEVSNFLKKQGNKLMTLDHGAIVYDLEGQNICLSDCLTIKANTNELRQLIFFPDGHLRYDWQHKGAILI